MNTHALRRDADAARLRELVAIAGGRVALQDLPTRPGRPIRLSIRCRTAASGRYPAEVQPEVGLRIDLPARYPFERPVLTIETPIFHPNVFASGVICQGERWLPGDGLDIVLKRIIRLVTFDPAFVNTASAANRVAAAWYVEQRRRTPEAFPTDRLVLDDMPGDRAIRACPSCGARLRLPRGRQGVVACPSCRAEFETAT